MGPVNVLRAQLQQRRVRLESARTRAPRPAEEIVRLLEEVDAALARMDAGSYGLCEVCHDPIESERLIADPLTRVCLDHLDATQKRALEQDLDFAVRIQTTLLPARNLSSAGWQTYYHYEPAGAVSGDYCDLLPSPRGLFFSTGDISGKGVGASLLMSHLHAIFRSLLPVGLPLTELVERANRVFCESTLPSCYATLVCGLATPSGEIELCNAGHCPPLAVRNGKPEEVEATGLPLGLFCDGHYGTARMHLAPGDSLVLYTDGVTEARGPLDVEYGAERLSAVLACCWAQVPEGLTNACLADLETFRAGVPKHDDITVMVLNRLPAA